MRYKGGHRCFRRITERFSDSDAQAAESGLSLLQSWTPLAELDTTVTFRVFSSSSSRTRTQKSFQVASRPAGSLRKLIWTRRFVKGYSFGTCWWQRDVSCSWSGFSSQVRGTFLKPGHGEQTRYNGFRRSGFQQIDFSCDILFITSSALAIVTSLFSSSPPSPPPAPSHVGLHGLRAPGASATTTSSPMSTP